MMQSLEYSYEGRSHKEIIVDQRRQLFNKTEAEVEKRKHFEEAVSSNVVQDYCYIQIFEG